MILKTRAGVLIVSEHIESIRIPFGLRPFCEVVMTSGAVHVVHPNELSKNLEVARCLKAV